MLRAMMVLLWLAFGCGQGLAEGVALGERPFGALVFGEAPGGKMLCTAGPCATGQSALMLRTPGQAVATYKRPVDLTHVDGVEISAPVYAYHQEQLFRVGFNILCAADQGEYCTTALIESFRGLYGLTRIFYFFDGAIPGASRQSWSYRMDNGWHLDVTRSMTDDIWHPPYVSIYEPTLMDRVRLAVNPNYRPHDH